MGKAGRIILGAGLIVGGILLTGGLGATGFLLGAARTAGMIAVGLGFGLVQRTLFKPAGLANRNNEIRQNIANPLAQLPIVYGTAKLGLKLVDIRTDHTNPKVLYIVGAICHGSQAGLGANAIKRIWFDEKLAFDAAGTVQLGFKKGSTAYAEVTKYLGTEAQAVDSTMATAFPASWTSLHRGRGIAYLVFKLTLHQDIYQSIPNITVEVEGAKVLDPRQTTVTYSWLTNPALQVLDYLISPIYGAAAGRRVQLAGAAVTNSGMNNFTAANVVDGNSATKGFDTNGVSAGAFIQFDFGRPVEIDRVDIWYDIQLSTPTQQFKWQYSDSPSSGYADVLPGGTYSMVIGVERRNTFRWPSHLIGAHRYARLVLTNTPSAADAIMGVDCFETEIDYQTFADEANTADVTVAVPPAEAAYANVINIPDLAPIKFTITGHGLSTGNIVKVDLEPGYSTSGIRTGGAPPEGRQFTITVVDTDHYTLDGTSGSGTYIKNSLRSGKANFRTIASLSTGTGPATVNGHGYSTGNRLILALAPGFASSGLTNAGRPLEGQAFDITSTGANTFTFDGANIAGTYTANSLIVAKLVNVAQYVSNGVLDTGQEPQENLRQILSSFRGRIIYQGGKFLCHTRKTTTTTVQFTDEDIRSIRWVVPGTKEKMNQVRAAFLNADRDWQPDQREYPRPADPNSYLTEDNGFSSVLEMDLPFVVSPYQADRLAQVALRESRDGISIEMTTGARGMLAQVGDVVGVTYATAGWSAKPFWVERFAFVPNSDLPVLTLVEYEPNAYVLTDAQLHSSIPNTGLPDASVPPDPPTGLSLSSTTSATREITKGIFAARIDATWTDTPNAFVEYYEVQAKPAAASVWLDRARVIPGDQAAIIEPVSAGVSWDVRVRAVTTLGLQSDWLTGSITVAAAPGTITKVLRIPLADFQPKDPTEDSRLVDGHPETVDGGTARLNVSAATNTSPINLTLGGTFGADNTDWLAVRNVGGNTAANGFWAVTWITPPTPDLLGSTGNGAYTSGGTAQRAQRYRAPWIAPAGITITQIMVRLTRAAAADHCVGRIRRQDSSGFTTLATTAEPTAGTTQDKTASLSEAVSDTRAYEVEVLLAPDATSGNAAVEYGEITYTMIDYQNAY